MPIDRFNLARLRAGTKPFRLHWFPSLRSTNDHAAILRQRGDLFAPALVLTGRQTAGRGRGEHAWWSSRGCITATFVFPIDSQLAPHQIPLLAGLAVRNAAAALTGNDDIQLKWPNDILYRGHKIAGLLCERASKADLIGLGMNVNLDHAAVPAPLRERVTSLARIKSNKDSTVDGHLDLTDVLITVARRLHHSITHHAERSFAECLKEYDTFHALRGRRISVTAFPGGAVLSGRCEGLDETGRLLVRTRSRLEPVIAGHIEMGNA